MARIVLVNPSHKYAKGINDATIIPPLGLAYLAAVLEKNNHKVQIIDACVLGIKPEMIAGSFDFKPDLVGISVNIITYKGAIECAKQCKSLYPNTPIVFGGPHCSSLPETVLQKNPAVDAVVIGEGENTLTEIAESLGKKDIFVNIKGVAYKYQGQIINNRPRSLIKNIDEIPFPAYHLLPDLKIYKTRSRARPVGYIITSRGCPFQCTFCNRSIFGNSWRPHSVSRVIDEIHFLVKQYGVRQIDIFDDNFTFDNNRAGEILDRLAKSRFKLYINLQTGVRVDRTNEELLLKMRKAGVFKIAFGIETADVNIQNRIKKCVDLEKAIFLTRITRSLGIVTVGFFMIGLPGDNAKSMEQTIEFLLRMNPHFANIAICIPFPGTELFEEIEKSGEFLEHIREGIDVGLFRGKIFYRLDSMRPKEIISYLRMAYKRFYIRPSKIIDILLTIKSIGELKWVFRVALKSAKDIFC